MKVRYRRLALLDIDNIHDYLGKRNPRAATEAIARIRDATDGLRVWPHRVTLAACGVPTSGRGRFALRRRL